MNTKLPLFENIYDYLKLDKAIINLLNKFCKMFWCSCKNIILTFRRFMFFNLLEHYNSSDNNALHILATGCVDNYKRH